MPADIDFYWNDFNKEINIRLNNQIKYLHLAFDKRNDCIYNIKENQHIYEKHNVNISNVYDWNNKSKIYVNRKYRAALGIKLCSYINSYNYLIYEKIPLLERSIKILSAIRNHPRDMYFTLLQSLNYEIAKHLLKGNQYSFGNNLGSLRVGIKRFSKEELVKRINWNKSFGFRNELIKKGYTPKSQDHPDGIDWKIHHSSDSVIFPIFRRSSQACINAKYYKFEFGYSREVCANDNKNAKKSISALKDKSFQELLDSRNLNFLNRLTAICSHFGDLKYELYFDVANLKR